MPLEVIDKKAKKRRFLTYDLEWFPTHKPHLTAAMGAEPLDLRIVGVFDGRRYRHYKSIETFLDGELTAENVGCLFYAHAGGLADVRFVLEHVIDHRPDLSVECKFSGSSAIIVKLSKGKQHWVLCDSYWLIQQPLAKIGAWIGHEKGARTGSGDDVFWADFETLKKYNEDDCVLLYKAIEYLQSVILDLGGELQMTIASTAMNLFRRRFLTKKIGTSDAVNEIASQAYVASRVEPFQKHVSNAEYLDINSSFPFAMTCPVPGDLLRTNRILSEREEDLQIARLTITVPDRHVPPLPYRADGKRIYFPVGSWTGWFDVQDVLLLLDGGGTIEKCHQVLHFAPCDDLAGYANTLYDIRKKSRSAAEKQVMKIFLNSLYGKFAEGTEKSSFHVRPSPSTLALPKYDPKNGINVGLAYVMPGIWEVIDKVQVQHRHVPISEAITARARANLTRYMWKAREVYYCDTDGFAIPPDSLPSYQQSKELGGLKHEKTIEKGHFLAPKLYAMYARDLENEGSDFQWLVKAKGFGKVRGAPQRQNLDESWVVDVNAGTRKITYDDFCHLLNGKEVFIEAFSRVKGGLKKGQTAPSQFLQSKALRGKVREKRCFDSKGHSRPWNVSELTP